MAKWSYWLCWQQLGQKSGRPAQHCPLCEASLTVGKYQSWNALHTDVNSYVTQRTLEAFNESLFSCPVACWCNIFARGDDPSNFNVFLKAYVSFWGCFSPGSVPKRLPFLYLDYYSQLFNLALLKAGKWIINCAVGVKTEINSLKEKENAMSSSLISVLLAYVITIAFLCEYVIKCHRYMV